MQERFTCLATAPCRHRAAIAGQCICVSPSISSSARRKKWIRKQWGGTGLRREHLEIGIDLPTLVKGSHGFSPATVVRLLRKNKGKNIWLMGGGELARDFLKADLVDELYIGMVPVLIGKGIPLFPPGFPQREFSLVENKTYSKGLIALKYKRKR